MGVKPRGMLHRNSMGDEVEREDRGRGRLVAERKLDGWVWTGNRGRWTAGRGNVGGDILARAEVGVEPREEDEFGEIALGKVGHSPERGRLGRNGEVEEFTGKREREEMVGQEEEIVGGEIVGEGVVDVDARGG